MQTIQYSDFIKRYDVNFRAKPNEEDFVGSGGFGYVYKGYDKLTHLSVAVKRSATDKNLLDEVEKAKQLPQHVNIARYLEGFRIETEADDFDVAILQYYPKGNLNQLIASGGLNDNQIRELILGILEGISFLHKGFTDSNGKHRSIIHRDLKPQNILIAEYKGVYTPLITDFGISKLVKTEDIHSTGGIELSNQMGTMMYKAPEQVLGGIVRSNLDLWAFGIILFKMLTGNLPFKADTQMSTDSILKKITESDLEEIFIQLKKYPEVYQKIIRKCLVRDIKSRVQTAGELIEMLKVSTNVIEEKNEKITNHQVFEEKTDDRVSSNHSYLEITEPLKPISKVIKENHFDALREISEEELAKWNQPNALSILRVGSVHRGDVIEIDRNFNKVVKLQFGVYGFYVEITGGALVNVGDHVEVEIFSVDFESHTLVLSLIRNLSITVPLKPVAEKISNDKLSNDNMKYGAVAIVVLIVLTILFANWKGNDNYISEEAATDSTAVAVVDSAAAISTIDLPNDKYVIADPNSFEDQIIKFISDDSRSVDKDNMIWFDTDKIKFKIDSPQLYDDEESNQQFENIVKILEAFPKVYIKIGNCTESYNNPEKNLKLSTGRAKSAKNALISRGIDSFRIEFGGYTGKSHIATALSVIRK